MPQIDIMILTNTINDKIFKMTTNAIESLIESEDPDTFNIILIESNKNSHYEYKNVNHFITPDSDFNYNTYLNIGEKKCECDYSAVSNNDVLFHKNWWTSMKKAMIEHNLDTASPRSPREQIGIMPQVEIRHRYTPESKIIFGHSLVYTFCGWFWAMKKEVREWLFPLDESFTFFYQDNDIIMRLLEKECKHALVAKSKVDHFGQQSHKILIDNGTYFKHTEKMRIHFENKYK
jgi:GT2 family glycosyltransferase